MRHWGCGVFVLGGGGGPFVLYSTALLSCIKSQTVIFLSVIRKTNKSVPMFVSIIILFIQLSCLHTGLWAWPCPHCGPYGKPWGPNYRLEQGVLRPAGWRAGVERETVCVGKRRDEDCGAVTVGVKGVLFTLSGWKKTAYKEMFSFAISKGLLLLITCEGYFVHILAQLEKHLSNVGAFV